MDKRYQVFISSTYTDLREERKAIIESLLNAKYIPAGMEMFSASNDEQFKYIKKIIDTCDYYVLIIAGRYGSINPSTKISYTEQEYDYVMSKGIPTLVFLYDDPYNLPFEKRDDKNRKLLDRFRKKVSYSRMCKMYNTQAILISDVINGLAVLKEEYPQVGWVRGGVVGDDKLLDQVKELKVQCYEKDKLIDELLSQEVEDDTEKDKCKTQNKELMKKCSEKDKKIGELIYELETKEKLIEEKNAELANRDFKWKNQINELNQQSSEKDKKISDLERHESEFKKNHDELIKQNDDLSQQCVEKDKKNDDLLSQVDKERLNRKVKESEYAKCYDELSTQIVELKKQCDEKDRKINDLLIKVESTEKLISEKEAEIVMSENKWKIQVEELIKKCNEKDRRINGLIKQEEKEKSSTRINESEPLDNIDDLLILLDRINLDELKLDEDEIEVKHEEINKKIIKLDQIENKEAIKLSEDNAKYSKYDHIIFHYSNTWEIEYAKISLKEIILFLGYDDKETIVIEDLQNKIMRFTSEHPLMHLGHDVSELNNQITFVTSVIEKLLELDFILKYKDLVIMTEEYKQYYDYLMVSVK